jgi:DNA (cytosine-5)-methyltransferase 1
MNVLDLFSGIGGFGLGLERAGMRTVAFCEIDPFRRRVIAKHWPEVPCFTDIQQLSAQHLTARGITVDVIAGGFPCQDVSVSGKRAGIDGARSGLWKEYARLIGELRPRYVIVENAAALKAKGHGFGRVLGDLATLGYDAWWDCIPASSVGAAHPRDRIWIVAYPAEARRDPRLCSPGEPLRYEAWRAEFERHRCGPRRFGRLSESGVPRIADGFSKGVDRVAALGDSIFVAIPEIIGRAIMNASSVCSNQHSPKEDERG